ncbi:hypothetical protein F4777DRAFT_539047 [Nemania sp. FL0916]|nr:hypothetical protein F4777DRAFT_539047 [Nemania sp. FL0916]
MGWIWSSGNAQKGATNHGASSNNTTTTTTTTTVETPSAPSAADSTFDDPEITKFLTQLQAELGSTRNNNNAPKPSNPPAPSPRAAAATITPPSQSTTTQQTTRSSDPNNAGPLDPVTESLLPTTMSCRQAFDIAFHCNSVGGQWTSVYRSGGMRSCGEFWEDFWFCMRTRAYSGSMKEDAIRGYYREKERKKYFTPGKPNSTDVWSPRTEKMAPEEVFAEPYERPDVSDEEWQRWEIERRREVLRMLREEERKEEEERRARER